RRLETRSTKYRPQRRAPARQQKRISSVDIACSGWALTIDYATRPRGASAAHGERNVSFFLKSVSTLEAFERADGRALQSTLPLPNELQCFPFDARRRRARVDQSANPGRCDERGPAGHGARRPWRAHS